MGSPQEVNEMHNAFVEFGVRTKNDRLTAEYISYGDTLKQLIRIQDEEVADAYDDAKEIYQNEWFDRIRSGPLAQLMKAKEGPPKVSTKKSAEEMNAAWEALTLEQKAKASALARQQAGLEPIPSS